MIAPTVESIVRDEIDASVDEAIARIRRRCEPLGPGAAALAEAIARATAGGKRFRPALVVAAFDAFGGDRERAPALYPVAAAFELLHTAFVVHDDVIDHDTVRRGVPNVAGEFRARARLQGALEAGETQLGDAAAILAGDLLVHEAERMFAVAPVDPWMRPALLDLLDDAVFTSVAGELADVENSISAECATSEATLSAARDKTAVYSFAAPLRAGAVLANAPADSMPVLQRIGERIGLAFQLVDDLVGAFGTRIEAGREEGADLREAKRTPLVALARETAEWARVSEALALAHTGPIAVREAQQLLDRSGARDQLRLLIEDTLSQADADAEASDLPLAVRDLLHSLTATLPERIP
ncbi:geranylgeranyl pyrophosphate synthase [Microbacterium sp. Root61]|uniref:polyprenyl synthetase family protein n=1 Tax=Microbacterium sp. Root61 TaxID=1736570 RepID=UPI0006FF4D7C|nr:polyprenyl synthetase family protein [Microbacterium sp. Root61]KRA23756.1 geranylgeranyl pyrophosphate synthase [Microbacterium sp. Root61]